MFQYEQQKCIHHKKDRYIYAVLFMNVNGIPFLEKQDRIHVRATTTNNTHGYM